jgi:molecular chaperone GrpE
MAANEKRPDGEEQLPPRRPDDGTQQQPGTELPEEAQPPVTLSYGEYEELKTLAKERDDYLRRLQHAVADYQNLQKRLARFQESARDSMLRSLAEGLMPVADSLALALEAARQTDGAEALVEGLQLVEQSLYAALERLDIRPIDALGQDFDPHFHEAALQQPVEGVPPGRVVRELKKGFILGDRLVVRPAQVVVSGPQ